MKKSPVFARARKNSKTGLPRGFALGYTAAMKKAHLAICTLAALMFLSAIQAAAQERVLRARTPIRIPDLPGYKTLKCDFHIHTVFSDGLVWPTVRVEEAWREGLDVIAITDHIEYHPHKADMTNDLNRSFEIARPLGKDLDLSVLRGSEITRAMPPGHLNAIFLTNSAPLETKYWTNAVQVAHQQGAFIFWNHPGWDAQTTNGLVLWYPEHTQLLAAGQLHGIEIVNTRDYYPEAHKWAIEKKLTLLGNSDIHSPIHFDYALANSDHRPLTLVFAKDRSAAAIKEALFARRTVVYSGSHLYGEEQYLRPLFEKSIAFNRASVKLKPKGSAVVQLANNSGLDFELTLAANPAGLEAPSRLVLPAGKTVLMRLRSTGKAGAPTPPRLAYNAANLWVAPNTPLTVILPLKISVAPPPKPAAK